MSRLILQRFDAEQQSPFNGIFPPVIEFCSRDETGEHIFPHRDSFFKAAKTGSKTMDHAKFSTLDDYLDDFFGPDSHAAQQIKTLHSQVEAKLEQLNAFSAGYIPVVEIVPPRKASFKGNIGAVMLAEKIADCMNEIAPHIDWGVAYDIVYQAPISDSNAIPMPRKHPGYAKQSQYMALDSFTAEGRTPYLVGIDDSSRFGRAFRDLGLFAQQNGKELIAAAVFQSYVSTDLQPQPATIERFNEQFDRVQQQEMNKSLRAFGLSINSLTEPEMQFFAQDESFNIASTSRFEGVIDYLAKEAEHLRQPILLPHNDHFFRKIEDGASLRLSRMPKTVTTKPIVTVKQRQP